MSLSGLAKSTLQICENGGYTAPSGHSVSIRAELDAALAGTRLYRPGDYGPVFAGLALRTSPSGAPQIEVTGETTQQASRRGVQQEGAAHVVALNFASARNPGGGFLGGAKAQEEDLCRVSALYVCQLRAPDYYASNRAQSSMLYTDHLIYSRDVPVFRDGRELLDQPYLLSFLTSPAPNAGEAARHGEAAADVRRALYARARQVLAVAAENGHETLILGAWGCGVFRNDPEAVADALGQALAEPGMRHAFRRVVFAVWERDQSVGNFAAFQRRFTASAT